MSSPVAEPAYGVLVPVKQIAIGKSRLAPLGESSRTALVEAFAIDTMLAASACSSVATVLVLTDDHEFASVLAAMGIAVIPDGATDDLNGSLVQGAAELHRRHAGLRFAALCADLPALRPAELDRALNRAASDTMSFVADTQAEGTTAVIAPNLDLFRPMFGPRSRAAHLQAGATEIHLGDIESLRRDVDTRADLRAARELGTGRRTTSVLSRLGL